MIYVCWQMQNNVPQYIYIFEPFVQQRIAAYEGLNSRLH